MKTFEDLEFKINRFGSFQAIENFDNGYGVFVVHGRSSHYRDNTYEIGVLKDGNLCFDTQITDYVLGHQSIDQINDVMKRVQEL